MDDGYAAAFPHLGATRDGVEQALRRMCDRLIGKNALAIEDNLATVRASIRDSNPAKSGIDCALHDLAANLLGVPLYQLFGGKVRDRVPLIRILAIKSPADMAERARALVDEGYRYVKLKVRAGRIRGVNSSSSPTSRRARAGARTRRRSRPWRWKR